jgi:transcriptional regulator with XRE-family HTH domain
MVIETFGKVLHEMRDENHISQEKLAEYCDLDRTYISLLERENVNRQLQLSSNWLKL